MNAEIDEKLKRIEDILDRVGAVALLLSRHGNIAWITAGQVEARVAQAIETAVCSLLITRDGRRYYFAPNNEAARLAEEEFAGLGYEAVIFPWHEGPGASLRKLIGDAVLYSDSPHPEARMANLTPLQVPLLPPEIDRLRTLSRDTAAATVEVLEALTPGATEHEMAARISSALLARGIAPTVLLMATDDRIHRYKHAVPRAGVLKRYGMLNLCARRSGLVVSITRFVHFGPMPGELAAAFEAAAQINAALLHATRDGALSREIFAAAQRAYASVGAADAIEHHHQGGACGYAERDWIITPNGSERVTAPQAFAYNPSLRGAKAEDTVLLANGKIEILTATPDLPTIEAAVSGATYSSAGVLIRH
ncbi:MAG TPA: M24 family metallopeptidase [Silvibacterium sp.]|nr:M24 family metallopeptidase [Silvibacterium sp.]